MTQQTIARLHDEIGDWHSDKAGPLKVISGFLSDGSYFFKNVKPQNLSLALADLKALVGKQADLVLEDAGQSKAGNQKWRLKSYPQSGGGQGPSGGGSAPTTAGGAPGPRQQPKLAKGDFRTPEQIVWNEAAHAAARVYQGTGSRDEFLGLLKTLLARAPIVDGAASGPTTAATRAGVQSAAEQPTSMLAGGAESVPTQAPAAPSTCEKCGSKDFAPVNERGWIDCNNCGYGVRGGG